MVTDLEKSKEELKKNGVGEFEKKSRKQGRDTLDQFKGNMIDPTRLDRSSLD